jgi:hypothetical protein
MISASNTCISICQQCGAENDVMLWLLMMNGHLISNFYGDTSMSSSEERVSLYLPQVRPSTVAQIW